MYPFMIDKEYTKKDIYSIIGVSTDTHDGNWDTGYNLYNNDFFIFINVNTPGRTGHIYKNKFEGDLLHWFAKNHTKLNNPQIQLLLHPPDMYMFFIDLTIRNLTHLQVSLLRFLIRIQPQFKSHGKLLTTLMKNIFQKKK